MISSVLQEDIKLSQIKNKSLFAYTYISHHYLFINGINQRRII